MGLRSFLSRLFFGDPAPWVHMPAAPSRDEPLDTFHAKADAYLAAFARERLWGCGMPGEDPCACGGDPECQWFILLKEANDPPLEGGGG